MRKQFRGYFSPTEQEFEALWRDAIFSFDANVLLGLYRSSPETQDVLLEILDNISDRIFLTHQAASEYLRNRINVISIRADAYVKLTTEIDKTQSFVEAIVQEHALRNGDQAVSAFEEASKRIKELTTEALRMEPDLLRDDTILGKVAGIFDGRIGNPYESPRLTEVYNEGAQRYRRSIPPGYRDDKKPEPDKYGDLVLWHQLIDEAKGKSKSLIFVTADAKEDWWLQHKGETFGPRPELRQEMMSAAGVDFYMYTTPRFLEFAKQFLALKVDTTQAETEFEKLEKQDKESTGFAFRNASYYIGAETYPQTAWNNAAFYGGDTNPISWNFGPKTSFYTSQTGFETQSRYLALLPIQGNLFHSPLGKWTCEIVDYPESPTGDVVAFRLKFESENRARAPRYLTLRLSLTWLENDPEWKYKNVISKVISEWLASNKTAGEISLTR